MTQQRNQGREILGRLSSEDQQWLASQASATSGKRIRVRVRADEDDVSGHDRSAGALVRVVVESDDADTEGHAITIRMPSVGEADALRKRLLLGGVLVATLALGGTGVAIALGDGASTTGGATQNVVEDVSYEDTTPLV